MACCVLEQTVNVELGTQVQDAVELGAQVQDARHITTVSRAGIVASCHLCSWVTCIQYSFKTVRIVLSERVEVQAIVLPLRPVLVLSAVLVGVVENDRDYVCAYVGGTEKAEGAREMASVRVSGVQGSGAQWRSGWWHSMENGTFILTAQDLVFDARIQV